MDSIIKKALIPIAGLASRFLPASRAVPKELWILVEKPMVQYVIEEAIASGINHIIFIAPKEKRFIVDYFKKPAKKLEKTLKERKRDESLLRLQKFNQLFEKTEFSLVEEKDALGDGHAVLKAKRLAGKEPCAVLFADDIVISQTPALKQLIDVFRASQKPVIALKRVGGEKISSYGIIGAEKIANRIFKIKEIVEKPSQDRAPSDIAIVGKYILTPEVFEFLAKTSPNKKGEIILADAFSQMLRAGKTIYGNEIDGKWLECGDIASYLKSNIYLALNHPRFGPEINKFIREL
ncbi:MAG: UTP--glucose-1-phosphate uridylyltransferase [Candidatus Nealsonbacteria bacterium]|nr:UTP--glucose-1-phosphate uridylyltransferase [Candidatus Nealsonbacteria bacterium]